MNQSILSVALSSVLSVGLISPVALAADAPTTKQSAIAHDPVHEVRRVLAETVDRALGADAVNKVLDMVNKTDRDRLAKEIVKGDETAYQKSADQVKQLWKDKYGKPFSAEGHIQDLGDLNVTVNGTGKDSKA